MYVQDDGFQTGQARINRDLVQREGRSWSSIGGADQYGFVRNLASMFLALNFQWNYETMKLQAERQQKLLLQHELEREMEESKKNQAERENQHIRSPSVCGSKIHFNFFKFTDKCFYFKLTADWNSAGSRWVQELAQQMQEEKQRIEDMLRTLKSCPETCFGVQTSVKLTGNWDMDMDLPYRSPW